MKCPSDDTFYEMLADHRDQLVEHVAACDVCAQRWDESEKVGDLILEAHDYLDRSHNREREQLLASIAAEAPENNTTVVKEHVRASRSARAKPWLGWGAIAIAVALVCMVAGFNSLRRATAFEKALASIRRAKSYRVRVEVTKPQGKEGLIIYHQDETFRMEARKAGKVVQFVVVSRRKPGISVNVAGQSFVRRPLNRGRIPPLMMLESLAKYKGRGRALGTKTTAGRSMVGFVISVSDIEAGVSGGTMEVWIDAETNRPVTLLLDLEDAGKARYFDFQWNIPLGSSLFSTAPPDGFVDRTPPPTGNAELVKHATYALRTYRKLTGAYPRGRVPYADQMRDQMFEKIGKQHKNDSGSPERARVMKATLGFTHIVDILRYKEDAVYRGAVVKRPEPRIVLLRWKVDDDRYQVIYADLRAELVTTGKLRSIEGRRP